MKEYKPLILNIDFLKLWGSQILSQLTIQIMNFVLILLLYTQTGSTIATSMLWVTVALPVILVGPFGAAASDMFNRRKLLMVTNLLQAAVVFLYSLIYQSSIFLLYGAVFVYSFLNQFYIPAESASLPSIVDKKYLPQANSLFFLTQQTSLIIGFGSAGLLVNYLGFEIAIAICSILLLLAFISVSFLPDIRVKAKRENIEDILFDFFKNITDGYRYIKDNHIVLAPFVLLLSLQISLTIIIVNIPLIVQDIFQASLDLVGPLLLYPGASGAILAALIVPKLLKKGLRKRKIIEYSFELLTVGIFMLVFIVPEMASPVRATVGSIVMMLMTAGMLGGAIPSQTFIQEVTPGGLRGRVFGNFWFIATVITIIPVIFSGTMSEVFGIRFLLLILGAFIFGLLYLSKRSADKFFFNGWGRNV